jgi:hypothetical protein
MRHYLIVGCNTFQNAGRAISPEGRKAALLELLDGRAGRVQAIVK